MPPLFRFSRWLPASVLYLLSAHLYIGNLFVLVFFLLSHWDNNYLSGNLLNVKDITVLAGLCREDNQTFSNQANLAASSS